jgi:large subunit ribosomal protein L21e
MPYQFYHGRTGVIFNVTKNAVGVEVTKVVGNRQLRKRIHVRVEHVRRSRCNENFLDRVKKGDAIRAEAKKRGEKVVVKREPEGPKGGQTIKSSSTTTEVFTPLAFIANYF